VAAKNESELSSLEWIHQVREKHYQKTKGRPLGVWLTPVDAKKAAQACRRLGLKVRIAQPRSRGRRQVAQKVLRG